MTFRPGTIISGRFSPDGHTIVYTAAFDAQPADLYIVRRDYPESQPMGIKGARLLAVSRKGEVAMLLKSESLAHFAWQGTFAIAPVGGSGAREVAEHVTSADWSPDGSQVIVIRHIADKFRLEFPLGKTVYETTNWIDQVRVSPDGMHCAFLQHALLGDDRGDVVVADASGSIRPISTGWAAAEGIAWTPSGKEVWFSAVHEGGDLELHAVDLGGRERRVITQPGALRLQDISATGEVLVSSEESGSKIELLPRGELSRDISWLNFSFSPVLSRDGKLVAIADQSLFGGNTYSVYLRSADASSSVRLGPGRPLDISSDNKFVIAYDNHGRLTLLPTGPGEIRTLQWHGMVADFATFFPDSRHILVEALRDGHYGIYVTDIDAAPLRLLADENHYEGAAKAISADDRFVVLRVKGQWVKQSTDSAAATPLLGVEPDDKVVRWNSDGTALFVVRAAENELTLTRVTLNSGQRDLLRHVRPASQLGLMSMQTDSDFDVDAAGNTSAVSYEINLGSLYTVTGLR